MSGDVQHAYFTPSRGVARAVCMYYIALASSALLGVGLLGSPSSLVCPTMYSTIGIYPVLVVLIMCPPFVNLFRSFYEL